MALGITLQWRLVVGRTAAVAGADKTEALLEVLLALFSHCDHVTPAHDSLHADQTIHRESAARKQMNARRTGAEK